MLTRFEVGREAPAAFCGDRRGASAVEFALILPLMLALWAGMAEMAHAIDNWRKVTQLARTVADLTSQGDPSGTNPITPATMTDILASSTSVLRPFSSANVWIRVSALEVNLVTSPLYPKVCSSLVSGTGASARATGIATDLSIPAGLYKDGQRYILTEVSTAYAPMLGTALVNLIKGINGSPTLKSSIAWPTRGGIAYGGNAYTEVILPNGAQCP